MENIIIIAVLCLLAVFAAVKFVQHFKGQGGCCGGGTYKAKKKRLKNIISKKTFRVEGMKCGNCKARVEEVVNDIDGVKIDFEDKWVHLRKSNTEPIIRVYSEAATMEEADALGKELMQIVYDMTKQ